MGAIRDNAGEVAIKTRREWIALGISGQLRCRFIWSEWSGTRLKLACADTDANGRSR